MAAKNSLKSMQDNLLEFIVINFTEIFMSKYKSLFCNYLFTVLNDSIIVKYIPILNIDALDITYKV